MPSFSDSIFLFILALLLFGPKRLPVLAREIGKWVGEFRRASNEFKMQMEEELRTSEQADRAKQIAAIEAAAPQPALLPDPEHPHLPSQTLAEDDPATETLQTGEQSNDLLAVPEPIPIASSGDLHLMPPATGLPQPRSAPSPLSGFIDAIPQQQAEQEPAAHV